MRMRKSIVVLAAVVGCVAGAFAEDDPFELIRSALKEGRRTVTVPKGVYEVAPAKGSRAYLRLDGVKDVTLDFSGSELRGLVQARVFHLENCENVVIRNLTVDYVRLPFTQAEIVSVDAEKSWVVRILAGYEAPTERLDEIWPLQVYDRKTLELKTPMRMGDGFRLEKTGADTYRVSGGADRRGDVGDYVVWRIAEPKGFDKHIGFLKDCRNCTLEGIAAYATPGRFFEERHCTATVYRDCRCDRRPPETDFIRRAVKRLRSGNHDGFWCIQDVVGPRILGCTMRYHCDDAINITGMYAIVLDVKGDEVRLAESPYGSYFDPGDEVEGMREDGRALPAMRVVAVRDGGELTSADHDYLNTLGMWPGLADRCRRVRFVKMEGAASLERGAAVISTRANGNGFVIRDCTLGCNRAHGIRLRASRGLVAGNDIRGCEGYPVYIGPEYEWFEGGCSRDVVLEENRMDKSERLVGSAAHRRPLPADSRPRTASAPKWDNAYVHGTTTDGRLFYGAGEKMTFRLELKGVEGTIPRGVYFYDWTLSANDGSERKGRAAAEVPFEVSTSLDRPGFVNLEATLVTADGRRVPKRHMWEKRVFFPGGAGVAIDALEPWPEPKDYDDYWRKLREQAFSVPIEVLERTERPCDNPGLRLWRMKLSSPEGYLPATGYLVIPKGCTPANRMKVTGLLSGYYNFAEKCPAWLTNHVDGIEMYINRHGCELDRPESYYVQFWKPVPYPPDHFRGLAIRGLRMFKYLMGLPEWNGKELYTRGSSGGGMQSFWMAMMIPEITSVDVTAPALADLYGFKYGRRTGELGERVDAINYFDIIYAARRVRCPVVMNAGLGDYTCPPAGLAMVYRELKAKKQITWHQGCSHGWWPPGHATQTFSSAEAVKSKVGVDELTAGGDKGADSRDPLEFMKKNHSR